MEMLVKIQKNQRMKRKQKETQEIEKNHDCNIAVKKKG